MTAFPLVQSKKLAEDAERYFANFVNKDKKRSERGHFNMALSASMIDFPLK